MVQLKVSNVWKEAAFLYFFEGFSIDGDGLNIQDIFDQMYRTPYDEIDALINELGLQVVDEFKNEDGDNLAILMASMARRFHRQVEAAYETPARFFIDTNEINEICRKVASDVLLEFEAVKNKMLAEQTLIIREREGSISMPEEKVEMEFVEQPV